MYDMQTNETTDLTAAKITVRHRQSMQKFNLAAADFIAFAAIECAADFEVQITHEGYVSCWIGLAKLHSRGHGSSAGKLLLETVLNTPKTVAWWQPAN